MLNVIIPIFRARETLPAALDSLVAQTYKMFTVTLVNDCDGLDYSDIIEEYTHRGLHFFYLQTEVNSGPGVARQTAIDASDMFDYIMFMDADDMMLPRCVEVLYKEAKKGDYDILTSSFLNERNYQAAVLMDVNSTPITWTHGKIYRTAYLKEKNIRFLPDLRLNEDSYFNLVAWNGTENRDRIGECLYLWRDNPNSLTRQGETHDFFYKSWDGYIYSQSMGLIKLFEIVGEKFPPALLAATLINMYKFMMQALHLEVKNYAEGERKAHLITGHETLLKVMNTKDFWFYIRDHLPACQLIAENELFFYKQRFIDWIEMYVKGTVTE